MLRRALLAFAVLAVSAAAQPEPADPGKVVYVTKMGSKQICRETVTITKDGWKASGAIDLFGQQKSDFNASLIHQSDLDFDYVIESKNLKKQDPKFVKATGTFEKGVFTTRIPEVLEGSLDLSDRKDVFVYENLCWASMIDLGRMLVNKGSQGKLKLGNCATGVVIVGAGKKPADFQVELTSHRRSAQVVRGQPTNLWIFRIKLPPGVEVNIVTTTRGLPLRYEVPAQKLAVTVDGYEDVRGPITKPTSLVDAGPWRAKLSKAGREWVHEKKVMVAMRDGVKLAADVYRPSKPGKYPTILGRTPYRRQSEGALKGAYYAERGYVYVAQDVRGRFDSEGTWFPLKNEERDGSDTLDWIANQPWSNGDVGMIGASYVAWVQWFAARSGNPHLKCIVPQVSPPDPHENIPYEGGAFMLGAVWWAQQLEAMQGKGKKPKWKTVFDTMPAGDFDKALKLEDSFLDEWLAHPPHDRKYWEPVCYQHLYSKMDLPAMHISGWFDGDEPGAIMNYPGMRKHAKTERARNSQYLIMGPWTHFFNSSRSIGDHDFGKEAVVDLDSRILRFFDRYLKNVDNGIETEPHVHTFTMGDNKWHAENDWPLPSTKWTRLYLASEKGQSQLRSGDGKLSLTSPPAGSRPPSVFKYDPHSPPEIPFDLDDLSGALALRDFSKDEDRKDDLEFTSPPLSGPVEIVGPVTADLWVASSAADTDFAVEMFRITTSGAMIPLKGGVQRLRYHQDPLEDTPVKPGNSVKVTVDLWATGVRLDQGERIHVVVSSWVWPGYVRNLNTLENPLTATEGVVATNRVFHDASRPSCLNLPVIPREGAPGLAFEKTKK